MDILSRYKAVIENTDNPTVLELGAAEGEDTMRYVAALVALNRPYRYVAFEPEPRHAAKLEAMASQGAFEFVPFAVGDRNGLVTWRASNHPYSGSVKEPVEHLTLYPHITFAEESKVFMERLDDADIRLGIGKVDWIWCDVQGAEDLVLAGGQATFARTRFFYTEYIECEAYRGQIGKDEIHRRLPGSWAIEEDYRQWEKGGDVLFRNLTVGS
jgi:FkbM family methyltransferase